jgi:hypothetical protein
MSGTELGNGYILKVESANSNSVLCTSNSSCTTRNDNDLVSKKDIHDDIVASDHNTTQQINLTARLASEIVHESDNVALLHDNTPLIATNNAADEDLDDFFDSL